MISNNNGNSNGNGHRRGSGSIGFLEKLERLAEFHEQRALALRTAFDEMRHDAIKTKTKRSQHVLDQALALEAHRSTSTRRKKHSHGPGSAGGRYSNGKLKARRQASADFLDLFSTTKSSKPDDPQVRKRGLGSLVRRGYLVKRGEGYVRTSKEYVV